MTYYYKDVKENLRRNMSPNVGTYATRFEYMSLQVPYVLTLADMDKTCK